MNVLVVNRDMKVGGGTTYIGHLVRALRRAGYSVQMWAAGGPREPNLRASATALRKLPIVSPWQRPLLAPLMRSERPDVVNVHGFTQARILAPLCHGLGVPLVVTIHGLIHEHRRDQWRDIFECAAAVMVMNERTGTEIRDLVAPSAKLFFQRLWVPFGAEPAGRRQAATFAYCGRLSKQKGAMAERFLRAVATLECDARVWIIGSGSRHAHLKRVARELGVCATFQGEVPSAHRMLGGADVVAGSGYVALEAIERGAAVIGLGFAGCFGAVHPGNLADALRVNFGDQTFGPIVESPDALPSALRRASDALTSGEAAEVRALVARTCSEQAVAPQITEFFERVAARQPFDDLSLPHDFDPMPAGRYARERAAMNRR